MAANLHNTDMELPSLTGLRLFTQVTLVGEAPLFWVFAVVLLGVGHGWGALTWGLAAVAGALAGVAAAAVSAGLAARVFASVVWATLVVPPVLAMAMLAQWWTYEVARRLERARSLAVDQERIRFAADLHDIQGHHLQVIALKSELAARLGASRTDEAVALMREVRQLAHDALMDTKAVVSGYRQVSLATELANAVKVLGAAGISAETEFTATAEGTAERLLGLVVREATTNILRHSQAAGGLEPDLAVVAEADTTTGAVAAATSTRPDIVILDLEMPPGDGLVAAERILGDVATRIVLVTRHARPGVLRRALATGVRAFVPKTTPAERLAEILREVHAGRRYVDPEIAASALSEDACPLTARELDVPRAARSGQSIDWIAGQVHLAPVMPWAGNPPCRAPGPWSPGRRRGPGRRRWTGGGPARPRRTAASRCARGSA